MRRTFGSLLILIGILLALLAIFFALMWASELEADFINVGTALGRDTAGPRVSTLVAAAAVGGAAVILVLVGRRLRRRP